MKRFLKKLTGYRKGGFTEPPAKDYEPAGVIHYGEWHLNIGGTYYEAYNQPDGSTAIWANGEHIGFYPKDQALLEIIDHAKEQK
jgi:hypothetical protein